MRVRPVKQCRRMMVVQIIDQFEKKGDFVVIIFCTQNNKSTVDGTSYARCTVMAKFHNNVCIHEKKSSKLFDLLLALKSGHGATMKLKCKLTLTLLEGELTKCQGNYCIHNEKENVEKLFDLLLVLMWVTVHHSN